MFVITCERTIDNGVKSLWNTFCVVEEMENALQFSVTSISFRTNCLRMDSFPGVLPPSVPTSLYE